MSFLGFLAIWSLTSALLAPLVGRMIARNDGRLLEPTVVLQPLPTQSRLSRPQVRRDDWRR